MGNEWSKLDTGKLTLDQLQTIPIETFWADCQGFGVTDFTVGILTVSATLFPGCGINSVPFLTRPAFKITTIEPYKCTMCVIGRVTLSAFILNNKARFACITVCGTWQTYQAIGHTTLNLTCLARGIEHMELGQTWCTWQIIIRASGAVGNPTGMCDTHGHSIDCYQPVPGLASQTNRYIRLVAGRTILRIAHLQTCCPFLIELVPIFTLVALPKQMNSTISKHEWFTDFSPVVKTFALLAFEAQPVFGFTA